MRKQLAAAILLLASACGGGGGGGGGGDGAVQLPPNRSPIFTSGGFSVAENVAAAATLSASDADGDPLTFSIGGGADAALFTVSGTQLQFRAQPNFEAPGDANGDNVYEVTIAVSDGKASVSVPVSITVTNDREGVAVRRVASIGEAWTGGASLDNGSVLLLTAQAVQRFDLAAETRSQYAVWDPSDPARGRFLSVASARIAFNGQVLVTARLANGYAGLWVLTPATSGPFNSYWSQPLLGLQYDPQAEDIGVQVGICANGNNCLTFGSVGKPAGATSDRYGSLLELPFNADPYAGASVALFGTPILRASGLRLPMALTGRPEPGDSTNFLILDQGATRFDEINRYRLPETVDFGWPAREGTEVLGPGAGPFTDPELVIARGSGAKQSAGATAMANYNGSVSSLNARTLVAGRDGRIYAVNNAALANNAVDGAGAYEDRTLDFRPDVGSIDHVVAIISTATKTLILDRDGDLFVLN
ncbi:hypothetical protein GGQ97_000878 [Sphingomonas kaistensis]|uniref:Cadherin domain-containing protein n=1 Tax=Sphingomonas kaistensis TaxID=298708 RepID=A0A7X5Y5C5_9SPHN|nr:cadherin repeat domain-containing protein [Sphingomonas kaistensis]NJC05085.1 hypothetical protein [Sphingomonas kaistensis]